MVKDMLLHQDCNGTRGKWITNMQKYDLELKPTNLVHGKGLNRLMEKRRIHKATIEHEQPPDKVYALLSSLKHIDWYTDVSFHLNKLSCILT